MCRVLLLVTRDTVCCRASFFVLSCAMHVLSCTCAVSLGVTPDGRLLSCILRFVLVAVESYIGVLVRSTVLDLAPLCHPAPLVTD